MTETRRRVLFAVCSEAAVLRASPLRPRRPRAGAVDTWREWRDSLHEFAPQRFQ